MRNDFETLRRVVSHDNLPVRFPIGWIVAGYLIAEKLNHVALWFLFWMVLLVVAIVYVLRVWSEVHVDVIDPKIEEK